MMLFVVIHEELERRVLRPQPQVLPAAPGRNSVNVVHSHLFNESYKSFYIFAWIYICEGSVSDITKFNTSQTSADKLFNEACLVANGKTNDRIWSYIPVHLMTFWQIKRRNPKDCGEGLSSAAGIEAAFVWRVHRVDEEECLPLYCRYFSSLSTCRNFS